MSNCENPRETGAEEDALADLTSDCEEEANWASLESANTSLTTL